MIILALLVLSLLLITITTLPFVLILLLSLVVVFKSPMIFIFAFLGGLYLDLVLVRSFGQSSVYFLIFIFLVFLYDRKFEIQSTPFVFLAAFFGALLYLLIFGYSYVIEQAVVSALIAVLFFKVLKGTNLEIRNPNIEIRNKFK